jgi:hypothetical protein
MILFDPVLSVGLSGMFKTIGAWIDYLLPGRPLATWIGIEAKRTLPWNCNAGLAIYALNELRPGYRQTLINGPNATRIWIEGVHGDGGGYRNPELGVWAGQIARQYAETVLGPTVLRRVRWPEGWVTPFEYVAKPAAPTIRIPYKGDEAWFRVLDSLESGSDPDFNSE